jgi:hypothetical protein
MEIVSLHAIPARSIVWAREAGRWALAVVAKVTYAVEPGVVVPARRSVPIHDRDVPNHDQAAASLACASDAVPFKPRADVVLVGHAYAPAGQLARSLGARLSVGPLDKTILVTGDRIWTRDGPGEPAPFVSMPLRYERAGRGHDGANPVGVAPGARLPNLLPDGWRPGRTPAAVEPACFAPIAPEWPERQARLGRHAGRWPPAPWHLEPIPGDVDAGFFCCAPRDQQLDRLVGDERVVLEGLRPDHPRLVTRLSGQRVRAFVERGGAASPLDMRCDTLWIDTDLGLCTLTWRGGLALEHAGEPGTILVALEAPGRELGWGEIDALRRAMLEQNERGATARLHVEAHGADPVTIATEALESVVDVTRPPAPHLLASPALPFRGGGALDAARGAHGEAAGEHDTARLGVDGARAPARAASPWAGAVAPSAPDLDARAAPGGFRSPAVLARIEEAIRPPPAPGAEPAPIPVEPEPALAATPPARPAARIKLLWFDPAVAPRLGDVEAWRLILAELDLRLLEEGVDDQRSAEAIAALAPGRNLAEVLVRGEALGAEGIEGAVSAATALNGRFEPPLVLAAGMLALPPDELEALKAALTVCAPFAAGDKKLRETLEGARVASAVPGPEAARGVAEIWTRRLAENLREAHRDLPADYLEEQIERILLEGRHYQRRTLFGKKWLRALLVTPGAAHGVPTYLPDELADRLPLFPRFEARLLAEVDLREDRYESHALALRVAALARVVDA